jgi:hypothetical protein
VNLQIFVVYRKLIFFPSVANQKEFFGEGFKGDKTFFPDHFASLPTSNTIKHNTSLIVALFR